MSSPTVTMPVPGATPTASRQAWLLPVVLFLVVFGIYAFTAEDDSINTDAYAASVEAWRIGTGATPWLDDVAVDELPGTHGDAAQGTWLVEALNGHVVAHRMAGPILIGIPAYWLLGDAAPTSFSIGPGGVAAAAASALTVLLLFLAVRSRLSEGLALCGALAFALATPTWSVSANGLWTHPVTQLGVAGGAYAASRGRWWMSGLFLGFGMLGRPHVAVIAAILGLGLAWSRRSLRPAIGIAAPTVASLGVLALWNHLMFGPWSIGGAYGDSRISQAMEGISGEPQAQWTNYLGFFFSADRGFFVWSPIVVLLLPALWRSWRNLPDWSRWLVLGGLVYTFFQLRLNYFAGGTGFHGYRHGLELLTCLVPALLFSLNRAGRLAKALAPVLIAAQFAAFTLGAVVEGFFIPLDRVWTDNALWLALRDQPTAVGTWLGLCLLGGAAVTLLLWTRSTGPLRRAGGNV